MVKIFFEAVRQFDVKFKRFYIFYAILAILAAICSVLVIRETGNMTMAVQLGVTADIRNFLLVILAVGAVQILLSCVMAFADKRFHGRVIHKIRSYFAARLLKMPYVDFSAKNSGEGVSLFTNDVRYSALFLSSFLLQQIAQIALLLVSAAFLIYINWWLSLIYFALFPLIMLMQAKFSKPIEEKHKKVSECRAGYNAVVSDSLQNPLTVLAYGLEANVEKNFSDSYQKFYDARYCAAKTSAFLESIGISIGLLPTFMLFLASSILVLNGDMSVASFVSMVIVALPISDWLADMTYHLVQLRFTSASAKRVYEFADCAIDELDKNISSPSPIVLSDKEYAASFENITFSYDDEVKVFDNISFSVEKGGITSIAGPSGCGKSTALKLILGLYKLESGQITVSSGSITYVPQDCHLLPISVRENIIADTPLCEERLRDACVNAEIYDFIMGLPEGFETVLHESSANVSGGQKQRIALARAFYQDADILLLDEVTSALDKATGDAILELLETYAETHDKTIIAVAHSKAVLDKSDKVIDFQKTHRITRSPRLQAPNP